MSYQYWNQEDTGNPKIWLLKNWSLLYFHLKLLFKDSWQFRKYVLVISSVENIISGDCEIGHCAISENFDLDSMINCAILILKNCDHFIKESIPLSSIWILEFHSYIEDKMDHHLYLEEHLDKIFQTSQDNREVD